MLHIFSLLAASSVSQAEVQMLEEGLDHEYAPISGFPHFTDAVAKLAFGDNSSVVKDGRVSGADVVRSFIYHWI